MNIRLVPLILGGAFVLPFLMARLEVKQTPTHRAASRRTTPR